MSPEKQSRAVDDERDAVVRVPRGRDRLDLRGRPSRSAPVTTGIPKRSTSSSPRARRDRDGRACGGCASASAAPARRIASSGSSGAPLSTKTATPPGSSPDDERVREPAPVHRPLDDHPLEGYATDVGRRDSRRARVLAADPRRRSCVRRSCGRCGPRRRALPARALRRRRARSASPSPAPGRPSPRESALNTLLTGEVESSLLGGHAARPSRSSSSTTARRPTTLVVPPPARPRPRTTATRSPSSPRRARPAHLRLDADRRPRLARRRRPRTTRGGRRATIRSATLARLERPDRAKRPHPAAAHGRSSVRIAYIAAVVRPAPRAPRLPARARGEPLARGLVARRRSSASPPLAPAARRSRAPPSLAAYLLALGLDPEAVALSPFGPSQAGRFYGVSNLLATILLVPALLGAGAARTAGHRRRRRSRSSPSRAAASAPTAAACSSCSPATRVLLLRTPAGRVRATAPRSRCAAAAVVALAHRPRRPRCGARRVEPRHGRASATGPGAVLADLGDRLELSARGRSQRWARRFAVLASLRRPRRVATRRPRRPVTDALLVALAVSLLVNDTPGDVLGVGAAAAFAVRRFEDATPRDARASLDRLRAMRRPTHRPRARCSPRSRSWPPAARDGRGRGDAGDGRRRDPRRDDRRRQRGPARARADRRRGRRRDRLRERRLRRLPHALRRRVERHRRPEPRRREAVVRARRRARSRRARAGCPPSASSSSHSRSRTSPQYVVDVDGRLTPPAPASRAPSRRSPAISTAR